MSGPDVLHRLSPVEVQQVKQLVEDVQAADGVPPLSDHVMLHLPAGGDADVHHLLVRRGDGLLAYAHVDATDGVQGASAELLVHPDHRGQGVGRQLVEALLGLSPDGRLRLWAHGDSAAAAALAASLGFARSRSLWQMRRPLDGSLELPASSLEAPYGVSLRTFVVGQDEQAWTDLNNKAFAGHPDQSNWGLREVQVREAEDWFDPEGFFLAERDGVLVGFHWTKVHGGASHDDHVHEAVGEVYVVGVDPSEQGRGLGPWLTAVGLEHLQDKGLPEVLLYVDEENTNAIRVYERLGFTRYATDVCYARS